METIERESQTPPYEKLRADVSKALGMEVFNGEVSFTYGPGVETRKVKMYCQLSQEQQHQLFKIFGVEFPTGNIHCEIELEMEGARA